MKRRPDLDRFPLLMFECEWCGQIAGFSADFLLAGDQLQIIYCAGCNSYSMKQQLRARLNEKEK